MRASNSPDFLSHVKTNLLASAVAGKFRGSASFSHHRIPPRRLSRLDPYRGHVLRGQRPHGECWWCQPTIPARVAADGASDIWRCVSVQGRRLQLARLDRFPNGEGSYTESGNPGPIRADKCLAPLVKYTYKYKNLEKANAPRCRGCGARGEVGWCLRAPRLLRRACHGRLASPAARFAPTAQRFF